jgi:hypothetical protein
MSSRLICHSRQVVNASTSQIAQLVEFRKRNSILLCNVVIEQDAISKDIAFEATVTEDCETFLCGDGVVG